MGTFLSIGFVYSIWLLLLQPLWGRNKYFKFLTSAGRPIILYSASYVRRAVGLALTKGLFDNEQVPFLGVGHFTDFDLGD